MQVLKQQLLKLLPLSVKRQLEILRFYRRNPSFLPFNKHQTGFSENTKLILSFPRSGSSWVGSIVGQDKVACYLREPITTQYQFLRKGLPSVFSFESCLLKNEYNTFIEQAFNGQPTPLKNITAFPDQWLNNNASKLLVIKEVNPLCVESFIKFKPQILYLVRHPYAVAKSFNALNWQGDDLISGKVSSCEFARIQSIRPTLLQTNFWHQIDYLQGWIEARTQNMLEDADYRLFAYERLCQQPMSEFKQVFEFFNMAWSNDTEQSILATFDQTKIVAEGDFSLKRAKNQIGRVTVNKENRKTYEIVLQAYIEGIMDYNTLNGSNYAPTYSDASEFVTFQ